MSAYHTFLSFFFSNVYMITNTHFFLTRFVSTTSSESPLSMITALEAGMSNGRFSLVLRKVQEFYLLLYWKQVASNFIWR